MTTTWLASRCPRARRSRFPSQVVVFEDVNLKAVVEWVDILVAIEPEGRPPAGALAELAAGFEISVLVELAGLDIAGDELGVVFVPVALDVKSAVVDGDKGNVASPGAVHPLGLVKGVAVEVVLEDQRPSGSHGVEVPGGLHLDQTKWLVAMAANFPDLLTPKRMS